MHAYLITGSDAQARQEYIQNRLAELTVNPVDMVLCRPEGEHIGIADIRAFTKRLLFAPYQSKHTAGIIYDAWRMTDEAQNALLKTLEEPPPHAILFLSAAGSDDLLPTIVSRCSTVAIQTANPDKEIAQSDLVQTLNSLSCGQRLTLLEPFTKDQETARAWLETSIAQIRHNMLDHIRRDTPDSQSGDEARLLTLLLKAYRDINGNINPKLAIETRLLSF